jgi:adenine-specific DNA-methyltransferase
VRSPKGRLELTWMGKDMALIPAEDGKYDYEWADPADPRACEVKSLEVTESVGEAAGETGANENLLVVGDSGDALRSLGTVPEWAAKYRGKVKLVYIDPPFNTDQTFEHYADQLEHSIWLTMMRDRIRDIKPLLAEDASIWVHLDDAEGHRMRVVLDEELGPENFVAEVVWQKADSTRNDAHGLSGDHDVLLVYRKSSQWKPNRLQRTAASNARFSSPDNDPKPWFDDNPSAPGAHTHQGMVYAVQHPVTGILHYPARGRCWWTEQSQILAEMQEYAPYELTDIGDAAKRADLCGVSTESVRAGVKAIMLAASPQQAQASARRRLEAGHWPLVVLRSGGQGGLGRKSYVPTSGLVPSTWWSNDLVGHNRQAKAEIKALFPGVNPFTTPKPERLLERVLQVGTRHDDLVMDCFAGSGTTAAVAHKMGRRWVTVELSPENVEKFTRPRLAKVVAGSDLGGVTSVTERVAVADLPAGVSPREAQNFATLLTKFTGGEELGVNVVQETTKVVRALGASADSPLSPEETKTLLALLRKMSNGSGTPSEVDVMPQVRSRLREKAKTRDETTVLWKGGGGFSVARIGPSMYEVDDGGEAYLSADATNGAWSKAVAGQLKFTLTPDDPVFCGIRNRQRLAVIDGVADMTVVRTVVENLGEKQKAVIVAKGVLPEAEALLAELSPGSRIRKAPGDLFGKTTVR